MIMVNPVFVRRVKIRLSTDRELKVIAVACLLWACQIQVLQTIPGVG